MDKTKLVVAANQEEKVVLQMYRKLARWDRNCFFMILQSVAWGAWTSKTDHYSWDQIRQRSELPKSRKAVGHGN